MLTGNNTSFVPFRLEALTPVHIGSGEDFSPLGYVIRQQDVGKYELWLIDTQAWLAANLDNSKIMKALDEGDMQALRFLLGAGNPEAFLLAKIRIENPALGRDLWEKRNSLANKAEIMAFMRNPFTHMPFVPASSIKGAIVTALTDYLDEKRKGKKPALCEARNDREYRNVMEEMFGKIQNHAMRKFGLADIGLPPGSTSIRSATGVSLKPDRTLPKTPCETLDPTSWEETGAYGNMRFKAPGKLAFCDGLQVSLQELGKICTNFYRRRYRSEFAKFYVKDHFADVGKYLDQVTKRVENCDGEQQILLRIGRYSHFECVTVSGAAPRLRKGCGTTRTLADLKMPFGWVILNFCSLADYNRGLAELDDAWQQKINARTMQAEAWQKKRQEEELRKREEEEAAKKREMELAAMSPQEKAIWELTQPEAIENQASEVYKKLDEFGELRNKAAEALMHFWQRNGKWEGKGLSKRQKEKVARIRQILRK